MDYIEMYGRRFGFYPREALADKIYCARASRMALKEKGIRSLAKALGRTETVPIHVSPESVIRLKKPCLLLRVQGFS